MGQYSEATVARQLEGIDQASKIYDWRYPMNSTEIQQFWILTLWGGLEITIMAPVSEAIKLQDASDEQGDDALWIIRAK